MNRDHRGVMVVLLALAAVAQCESLPAQTVIDRGTRGAAQLSAPIKIQLDGIPTSSLVTMLLRDVMKVPYVITPEVLADRRPTSVRLVIPQNEVPQHVVTYLRRSGFSVSLVGGTVYVGRGGGRSGISPAAAPVDPAAGPSSSVPAGSPVGDVGPYKSTRSMMAGPSANAPGRAGRDVVEGPNSHAGMQSSSPQTNNGLPAELAAPSMPFGIPTQHVVFSPAHRDTSYLAQMLGDVLPGLKFGAAGAVKADVGAGIIQPQSSPDLLIMTGSNSDLAAARRLLPVLDRPRPMVAVKAVVMSVSNVTARGSALSILAEVAGRRVQLGSFAGEASGGQFVRIASGAVTAVLSAVREDSRFKVVATPNLAALSGAVAAINSGSQVPIVSAVTIAEGGTPVQSIEYRDSGITLEVRPVVRGELIELQVKEERSTFVRTTTGVADTPTLQRSAASASVVLKSGESVALAGLTEESDGNRREGIFGGLLGVRQRDKGRAELAVIITAEIVPAPVVPPGQFLDLVDSTDELAPNPPAEGGRLD